MNCSIVKTNPNSTLVEFLGVQTWVPTMLLDGQGRLSLKGQDKVLKTYQSHSPKGNLNRLKGYYYLCTKKAIKYQEKTGVQVEIEVSYSSRRCLVNLFVPYSSLVVTGERIFIKNDLMDTFYKRCRKFLGGTFNSDFCFTRDHGVGHLELHRESRDY